MFPITSELGTFEGRRKIVNFTMNSETEKNAFD